MNWILEADREPNALRVAAAARNAGHGIMLLEKQKYAFGLLDGEQDDLSPAPIFKTAPVLAYGSSTMVRAVQRYGARFGWTPVAWAPWDLLRCSSYLPWLGSLSIQKEYKTLLLGSLSDPDTQDHLYATLAEDGCLFIRPDEGDKLFGGSLIERERLSDCVSNLLGTLPASTECVVSRPVVVRREWRCFVRVGEPSPEHCGVITSSQYKEGGRSRVEPGCPAEVARFAESIASMWPHGEARMPAIVVDVAELQGELAAVEVQTVHCAGLYACDEDALVRELADLAAAWQPPKFSY